MTEAQSPAPKKAPAKKPKPPALEDKPFQTFIQEDFIPTLAKALVTEGIEGAELQLIEQALPVTGSDPKQLFWQVEGRWANGDRQFNLYFFDESIKGSKGFSYATNRRSSSTLESFMIDERRVTLDLMVLYTLQRLNSQKWLTGN